MFATGLAATIATSACTPHRAAPDGALALASPPPVMLLVYNHNWLPVRIYAAARDGALHRLGTFTAATGELIEIPRQLYAGGGLLYFVFALVGSDEAWAPDGISVAPGDVVVWRIDARLHHSSVLVW